MIGKTIEELHIGDKAEFSKTMSETDIYLYAGITGDFNPAHINEEYARNTQDPRLVLCELVVYAFWRPKISSGSPVRLIRGLFEVWCARLSQ
jgi:acyl dehydratase